MACGLYGKVPSKRDFIAIAVPRRFLTVWEDWLQAGIAASRQFMGEGWQDAYLTAPIWRFWLGGEVAGADTVGALMPSVDGVGRYFPLTAFACAPEGMSIAPPTADAMDGWFETIEAKMLAVLEADGAADPAEVAAALPAPAFAARAKPAPPPVRPAETMAVWLAPGDDVSGILRHLDQRDRDTVHAGRSYFWTLGGENYRSQVLACAGLPDPNLFAGFLTGKFDAKEDA